MLSKDPNDRPHDAEKLAAMLNALTDIPEWASEDAKEWWHTNLPELATPPICQETDLEITSDFAVVDAAKLKA